MQLTIGSDLCRVCQLFPESKPLYEFLRTSVPPLCLRDNDYIAHVLPSTSNSLNAPPLLPAAPPYSLDAPSEAAVLLSLEGEGKSRSLQENKAVWVLITRFGTFFTCV